MARQDKKSYELSEAEQRDLVTLIQQGKPLPEKYRFILFEDKREVELVWNGKTRDVCTTVLPFQTLEHIDDLTWFDHAVALVDKLPLTVSPSSLEGFDARVAESVAIGSRMELGDVEDRSVLGQAIHGCLAADLASDDCPLAVGDVLAILQRMGVADAVDASSLHRQVGAVRAWLRSRWPDAKVVVELPMQRLLSNGQISTGRADLLLRTASGWILFDHKSTQQGSAQWAALARSHARGNWLPMGRRSRR